MRRGFRVHAAMWILGVVGPLLAMGAQARADALVVCNVGGPGSTSQAQPVLDMFLRHMEKTQGLKRGSMTGEYHTTLAGCSAYVARAKPVLGVFNITAYLQEAEAWKLRPVAHMGGVASQRYHVLVKKGGLSTLAQLKGKTLISTVKDMRFVGRIIMQGKLDARSAFARVKVTARPLKALRNVARGKQDAAIVDRLAYAEMSKLRLPAELVSIHASAGLPGLTLAVLGVNAKGGKPEARLGKVLARLCSGDGQKMCQTFQIKGFKRANPRVYSKLLKQYGAR